MKRRSFVTKAAAFLAAPLTLAGNTKAAKDSGEVVGSQKSISLSSSEWGKEGHRNVPFKPEKSLNHALTGANTIRLPNTQANRDEVAQGILWYFFDYHICRIIVRHPNVESSREFRNTLWLHIADDRPKIPVSLDIGRLQKTNITGNAHCMTYIHLGIANTENEDDLLGHVLPIGSGLLFVGVGCCGEGTKEIAKARTWAKKIILLED